MIRFELAHKVLGVDEITVVEVDAKGSWDAVEEVRAGLPDGQVVAYVRVVG